MTENFNHIEIEKKWQKIWDDSQLYKTDETSDKEKYYVLEMFLYPSGNIHMGLNWSLIVLKKHRLSRPTAQSQG